MTGNEVIAWIERVVGRSVKVSRLPWSLIRAVGLVKPMSPELAETAYLWKRAHHLVTDAAHAAFIAPTTA